jgi:translation initiation factor IF-3
MKYFLVLITALCVSTTASFNRITPCFLASKPENSRNEVVVHMNRPTVSSNRGNRIGDKRYQARQETSNRPPMNEEIQAKELRVVTPSPNGKDVALGIMSREKALEKAVELGNLDLIVINEHSDPPVCKIVDYSKYRYSQEKKAKEVKKNSKASELKEIKMSYKIDIHDYDVRKKSAMKFIQQGNRVKCTVMFRGRETQHDKLGFELLEKLASEMDTICIQEGRPKREGRNLSLLLTPKPEVLRAVNEARKAAKKLKSLKGDDDDDDDDDLDEEEEDGYPDDDQRDTSEKLKREKTLEELIGTSEYL